jgi:transposase InsO family protein
MVTPAARRDAVAHLCSEHGVSQRRACRAIGVERTSIRYRHRRPDDGAVRSRLRDLAAERRRFGWRRLHVLLSREGVHVNHKSCGGSTERSGCRFAGVAGASGLWAHGRRWSCRKVPTSGGRWTSSATR